MYITPSKFSQLTTAPQEILQHLQRSEPLLTNVTLWLAIDAIDDLLAKGAELNEETVTTAVTEALPLSSEGEQQTAVNAVQLLIALLHAASGTIDSYVGGQYSTPLNPIPAGLDKHCMNIAFYDLAGTTVHEGDPAHTRWKATIRWLEKVGSGDISLGVNESGVEPAVSQNKAEVGVVGAAFSGLPW